MSNICSKKVVDTKRLFYYNVIRTHVRKQEHGKTKQQVGVEIYMKNIEIKSSEFKRKIVIKNKFRFTLSLVFVVLAVSFSLFTFKVQSSDLKVSSPEYLGITVRSGDTLWTIAQRYNKNGDIREYIHDMKSLNKLKSSDIFAGDRLLLPLK